jgi:predicted transcriptional regulator
MNEIDYKTLYEQAQAKLDKIAYGEFKRQVDNELSITYKIDSGYDCKAQRERLDNNDSFEFLSRLDRDDVQRYIDEIGYEKLWSIIKDLYQDWKNETKEEGV